jgi:hypothetical protein
MSNVISILIESVSRQVPAEVIGSGQFKYTRPAHTARTYYITKTYDDGTEESRHTNSDGEGLFGIDVHGSEYQIRGTGQFCIPGRTAAEVRRNLRNHFKKDISDGATITFELDF